MTEVGLNAHLLVSPGTETKRGGCSAKARVDAIHPEHDSALPIRADIVRIRAWLGPSRQARAGRSEMK